MALYVIARLSLECAHFTLFLLSNLFFFYVVAKVQIVIVYCQDLRFLDREDMIINFDKLLEADVF